MATSDPSGTGSRQSQDYVVDGNDGSRSQSSSPSQSQSQSQAQSEQQREEEQQQQPTAVSLLLTNVKRSNKNTTTTTSHKRRRLTWQEQRHDYFQRLYHSCTKQLHQQIKRIKQMETAKCARRIKRQHIKQQQQQQPQQQQQDLQQQQRLQAWKNLSLDQVVTHIVLHCLGLHTLQPPPLVSVSEETEAKCSLVRPSSTTSAQHDDHRNQYDEKEHEIGDDDKQLLHRDRGLSDPGNNVEHVDDDDDDDDKKDHNKSDGRNNPSASSQCDNKINTSITTATDNEIRPSSIQFDPEQDHCIQIILQHKYMAECLERWNKEIANYQHWCWKLQQQQQDRDHGLQTAKSRHLATTTTTIGARHSRASAHGDDNNPRDGINRQQHDSSSSLSRKRFKVGETVDFTKSLFVSLGGDSGVASMEAEYESSVVNDHDGDDDDFDNPDDPYLARILHHSDNGTTGMTKKKNRQGQRARRAKAMVLQSKQDRHGNHNTDNYIKKRGGAMPTPSLNWRSSKKNQQQQQQQQIQRRSQINKDDDQLPHQQDHYDHQSAITAATSTTMTTARAGINRRDPVRTSTGMTRVTTTMNHHRDEHTNTAKVNDKVAALHPSWEAKKAQPKPTIVTFQGKKITFDDNDE